MLVRWCAAVRTVEFASPPPTPLLPQAPRATRCHGPHRLLFVRPCSAKKPASGEQAGGGGSMLSKSVLLRSGVALFALGFVDAGYSGDWSRIGAISKDTEDQLKLGAYAVVPLSLAFIFFVSEDSNES